MTNHDPNSDPTWRGIRFRDAANIPHDTPLTTYNRAMLRLVCWLVIALSGPMALACLIALAR